MTKEDIPRILEENAKRKAVLFAPYNPVTGTGSPIDRVPVTFYAGGNKFVWNIPKSMYKVHKDLIDQLNKTGSLLEVMASVGPITSDMDAVLRFIELRFKYDFEFWVYVTCRITDKRTKQTIPFKLNRPQRKVVVAFEKMRLALKPIRAIIDKARQWGGSTVIQAYMLWIQQIHKTAWHSSIVTAVEDQARAVRGKYSDMAKNYPAEFGKITLAPFEGSSKQRFVVERECIIGIGSAEKPDSLRTHDFAMCHFSEAAFFKSTTTKSAEDLVQNLRATIPDVPYALEVLESTAKGVGNFFHREWLAAKAGESGYVPIFVAWHEIEMYQLKIKDYTKFIEKMWTDTYAQFLWSLGATLEGINWYFTFKKAKHYDNWRMMNEFPSTCLSKGTRIGTTEGIFKIENCNPGNKTSFGIIEKVINNGTRPVFKLTTNLGYEIKCTADHLIKAYNSGFDKEWFKEWVRLDELKKGDVIALSPPAFASEIYNVEWDEAFVHHSIKITPEFGRFLGIFMGDGAYSTCGISIACDAKDRDFIDDTKILIDNLLGIELHERFIGKNKGCCELRCGKKDLIKYFLKLGIIHINGTGYKRKICIPDCIWMSPKPVVAEFLKGIFETDGFNGYQHPQVILFSKYTEFLKDIQVLLLGFGITSTLRSRPVINSTGYEYISNTIRLLGEQADLFNKEIGFLSKRKKGYFKQTKVKNYVKRTKVSLSDTVESIEYIGEEQVFDLTINPGHQFSANGILVHNCDESFSASDKRVFSPFYVRNARKNNTPPEFIGELKGKSHLGKEALEGLEFQKDPKGKLWIWMMPDNSIKVSDRYVVSVDIGGRWAKADYSVIRVFDRYWMTEPGGIPEVVATWRGHLDQDLVAWVAAQIAKFYNNALLIVESNSLDKDEETGEKGGHFLTILDELVRFYPNIYARTDPEKIRQGLPIKYGFQTNITTKPMVIDLLNAVLREEGYIERDERACNEMDTYEIKESGSYGAVAGCKDDLVMSTAIGLWCALKFMPLPKVIEQTQARPKKRIISEATI